jgi:AP-1 complex subunit beta-1
MPLSSLAVNTFVKVGQDASGLMPVLHRLSKDTDDSNPLIRALAIRTMGCLRAEKILDYLCDPLRKCLKDESPYVRKTAAICVAKLYDLKAQLAIENGFVQGLIEMLSDANPMVVANAVTALSEIQETINSKGEGLSLFAMDSRLLGKLLIALGECTEWGRIAILAAVASYKTADEKEAEHICERVVPQFQHANASVVLAAVQVRPRFIDVLLCPFV